MNPQKFHDVQISVFIRCPRLFCHHTETSATSSLSLYTPNVVFVFPTSITKITSLLTLLPSHCSPSAKTAIFTIPVLPQPQRLRSLINQVQFLRRSTKYPAPIKGNGSNISAHCSLFPTSPPRPLPIFVIKDNHHSAKFKSPSPHFKSMSFKGNGESPPISSVKAHR